MPVVKPKINIKTPKEPATAALADEAPTPTIAPPEHIDPMPSNGVKMVQWFDDHFYKVVTPEEATEYYPSVTTVLGIIIPRFLVRWRADVGNEEADRRLNEGSARGSRIHHATSLMEAGGKVVFNDFRNPKYTRAELLSLEESSDKGMVVIQEQFEMIQIIRYLRWVRTIGAQLVENETIVFDHELKAAGTMDRCYHINAGKYLVAGKTPLELKESGLYVADLKSSSEISDSYYDQVSTYAMMYSAMRKEPIMGGLIVHTNSDVKNGIEGLTTKFIPQGELNEHFQDFKDIFKVWRRSNPNKQPKVFEFPSIITMESEV